MVEMMIIIRVMKIAIRLGTPPRAAGVRAAGRAPSGNKSNHAGGRSALERSELGGRSSSLLASPFLPKSGPALHAYALKGRHPHPSSPTLASFTSCKARGL